jgi:hypothetical protein
MAGTSEFSQAEAALAAFSYTLSGATVASASVDIGHVAVTVTLAFRGPLSITAVTSDTPLPRVRARTLAALREMAAGVMVGGVGSTVPRITTGTGHVFTQTGRSFRPPNAVLFSGTCEVGFVRGEVRVSGSVGYALDVSALPHHEAEPPPWDGSPDARAWFVRHEHELSSIGVIVLAAVPFDPAPLVSI